MINRPFFRLHVGLLLLGVAIAGCWVYYSRGFGFIHALTQVRSVYVAFLPILTGLWLFIRFVRWQFLLRRIGVRVPIRPGLSIYFASLAGTATPAYIGEVIRSVFMRQQFGVPLRITTVVLVVERLLDVAALGMIAALTLDHLWLRSLVLITVGILFFGVLVRQHSSRTNAPPNSSLAQLYHATVWAPAFALSLVAWTLVALLITFAASSFELSVPPFTSMHIFSIATLVGGFTLMPAGIGAMGSTAIWQLQSDSLSLPQAVLVITLVRLFSTGLSLILGFSFLLYRLRTTGYTTIADSVVHFDEIAQEYSHQFSEHVWNHLIDRKLKLITAALPESPANAGIGLDLGCGLGRQCIEMGKRGYQVVGMDPAYELIRQGHQAGATVVAGDALQLPFTNESFDFVYMIGVLHHLPGMWAQEAACREVVRILKPDGLLIVHETNPRNPLFRFYMGYIFPLLKSIDEGTEWWIDPPRWKMVKELQLAKVDYFTFLPDFVPHFMMRRALAVEHWLEMSIFSSYSVHYVVTLRKASRESAPVAFNARQPVPFSQLALDHS